ncbi:hypothetical protein [Thermanaerovibrio acidaminovorans]|uniref:hypothetical protein n=1 Tax=Thermanaerovibrio acidaminovorans TaxID=81462 RepID=UPI002491AA6C|nr:hypothetical protein [Thermanaerovibrio acidaminovorans]
MKARFIIIGGLLSLLLASTAALGTSGPYSVYASVSTSSSIQAVMGALSAERVPGDFTVPEGKTAVITGFSYEDPKTGYRSNKLGENIYSVTLGKYMVNSSGNPIMQLPPGKYCFIVGGYPGAKGVLTYNLEP